MYISACGRGRSSRWVGWGYLKLGPAGLKPGIQACHYLQQVHHSLQWQADKAARLLRAPLLSYTVVQSPHDHGACTMHLHRSRSFSPGKALVHTRARTCSSTQCSTHQMGNESPHCLTTITPPLYSAASLHNLAASLEPARPPPSTTQLRPTRRQLKPSIDTAAQSASPPGCTLS